MNKYIYENVKLLSVIDGDTIDVEIDLGLTVFCKTRLRLYGYNAPEMNSESGLRSKAALEALLDGFKIKIQTFKNKHQVDKKEKYGRYLAAVTVIDEKGNEHDVVSSLLLFGYGVVAMYNSPAPEVPNILRSAVPISWSKEWGNAIADVTRSIEMMKPADGEIPVYPIQVGVSWEDSGSMPMPDDQPKSTQPSAMWIPNVPAAVEKNEFGEGWTVRPDWMNEADAAAKAVMADWPEWKKNLLTQSYESKSFEPRTPVSIEPQTTGKFPEKVPPNPAESDYKPDIFVSPDLRSLASRGMLDEKDWPVWTAELCRKVNCPTEEGAKRYPPDGRYCANESPGPACTCEAKCENPCKGRCGCMACSDAYGDDLSSQGD